MTSHTARLYAIALALIVFFLTWAVVAARPVASPPPERRALQENRVLQQEVRIANRILALRSRLARAPGTAPHVRVVQAAPVTATRTS